MRETYVNAEFFHLILTEATNALEWRSPAHTFEGHPAFILAHHGWIGLGWLRHTPGVLGVYETAGARKLRVQTQGPSETSSNVRAARHDGVDGIWNRIPLDNFYTPP